MKQFLLSTLCVTAALSLLTSNSQAQSPSGTGTTGTGTTGTGTPGPGTGVGGQHRGGAVGPERRAREIIAKFDKDGDHALNAAELAAFFQSVRNHVAQHLSQQPSNGTSTATPPTIGASQPGHGTPQEHAARAIEKFDKNGDGKLEAGELAAMLIAIREHAMEKRGQSQGLGQGQSSGQAQSQAQNHSAPAITVPSGSGN